MAKQTGTPAAGSAGTDTQLFDNSTITNTLPEVSKEELSQNPYARLSKWVSQSVVAPQGGDAAEADQPVEGDVAAATAETQTEEPTQTEEETSTTEETEETTEETEESAENVDAFNTLEGDENFPDFKALRAKYPRNASDAVLREAADYAQNAKKYHDFVNELGGEPFAEPVKKIASALKEGNTDAFFTGIHETGGTEGLLSVVAGALDLALLRSNEFAASKDNEAAAAFGQTLSAITETAIKERFGKDVDLQRLERAVDLARQGWLDKIEKWRDPENGVDIDEVEELLAIDADPRLKAILKENAELKAHEAERAAAAKTGETQRTQALEASFSEAAQKNISSVFEDVIWKSSPLQASDKDDAATAEAKRIMRQSIMHDAYNAFNRSPEKAALQKNFSLGKSETAIWRSEFTKAVKNAIVQTKAANKAAEEVIVRLKWQSRNGKSPQSSTATNTTNANNAKAATGAIKAQQPDGRTQPNGDLSAPTNVQQLLYERLRAAGI